MDPLPFASIHHGSDSIFWVSVCKQMRSSTGMKKCHFIIWIWSYYDAVIRAHQPSEPAIAAIITVGLFSTGTEKLFQVPSGVSSSYKLYAIPEPVMQLLRPAQKDSVNLSVVLSNVSLQVLALKIWLCAAAMTVTAIKKASLPSCTKVLIVINVWSQLVEWLDIGTGRHIGLNPTDASCWYSGTTAVVFSQRDVLILHAVTILLESEEESSSSANSIL